MKKVETPEKGLYDLIFTKKGFVKGGRFDSKEKQDDPKLQERLKRADELGVSYSFYKKMIGIK